MSRKNLFGYLGIAVAVIEAFKQDLESLDDLVRTQAIDFFAHSQIYAFGQDVFDDCDPVEELLGSVSSFQMRLL